MTKIAYIQKYKGEFPSPCCYSAWEGLKFLGYDCRFFAEEELPSLPLTKNTIVVGWVRVVQKALAQIGVPKPEPLDYPEELRSHFGRSIYRSTLGTVRNTNLQQSIFIKPVEHKLFTGYVVERGPDLEETKDFPDDTPIWVSAIIDFVSEWRCFIHYGSIVGIKHYLGDPWVLPYKSTLYTMKYDYDNSPVAYSLDVGITRDGQTCLVEVNDAFALGNYALSSLTYVEMLISRWHELVSTSTSK